MNKYLNGSSSITEDLNQYIVALPIVRPSVLIGTGLFNRPVPPGDSMLYQITYFTGMEGECIQLGKCTATVIKVDQLGLSIMGNFHFDWLHYYARILAVG